MSQQIHILFNLHEVDGITIREQVEFMAAAIRNQREAMRGIASQSRIDLYTQFAQFLDASIDAHEAEIKKRGDDVGAGAHATTKDNVETRWPKYLDLIEIME